jgi:hypothetical protein
MSVRKPRYRINFAVQRRVPGSKRKVYENDTGSFETEVLWDAVYPQVKKVANRKFPVTEGWIVMGYCRAYK